MEVVKELLAAGAPVRFPGCTPPALCRAVREGEVATARLLLEAGADPADEATSPVAYAILGGNSDALKLLLDAKASPDTIAPLRAGDTPALQFAVDRDTDDLQCSFVLMRAGARWQQGLPPAEKIKRRLIRAAYAGDEASVETLLAAHPHVQSDHFECLADALCEPWNQGGTGISRISESVNVETPPPIIAALIAKRSGCVRLLLEYGAAAYRPPPPTGSGAIGASVLKSAQRSDDEASLILILQVRRHPNPPPMPPPPPPPPQHTHKTHTYARKHTYTHIQTSTNTYTHIYTHTHITHIHTFSRGEHLSSAFLPF